jgi:hypothetical protein
MGFSYETLEKYLAEGAGAVPANVAARIEALKNASDHKRALPPIGPS